MAGRPPAAPSLREHPQGTVVGVRAWLGSPAPLFPISCALARFVGFMCDSLMDGCRGSLLLQMMPRSYRRAGYRGDAFCWWP